MYTLEVNQLGSKNSYGNRGQSSHMLYALWSIYRLFPDPGNRSTGIFSVLAKRRHKKSKNIVVGQ